MVSKSQLKLITSLARKKYRDNSGLFVAEGPKVVKELLEAGLELTALYATSAPEGIQAPYEEVSGVVLQKMSSLKNATSPLAVFKIPQLPEPGHSGLIVALDAVRDPGNLGTIIRLCDWFGVEQLICTPDTADCFNPKVVQASMGSLGRVQVHYLSMEEFLGTSELPVYGACMDGANVYSEELPDEAILVLGNEGKGISREIMKILTNRVTIPRFGRLQQTESLNVATAAAVLLSEFRRSTGK